MKSGQGFLLVFSLTQLSSVNELGPLREQIVRIKGSKVSTSERCAVRTLYSSQTLPSRLQVPIVLVGNKSDLRPERQVPREVGTNLSRAWGNVPYYEASARKKINVDEIFADIVRQCRAWELVNGSASQSVKSGRKDKKCVVM